MSYVVLARKYRPPDFDALVGQEHVVQALSNALTTQRLHHAYLFTGTRGVGKTTISRILAKSLNCVGPDGTGGITAHPCGVCHVCRDIDAGRFIDYVELDAASNRGVDEISQLLDQAVYKPVIGRFKVYMIDEVHMLSTTAFNAMLKTLEEPPEYLKFVLATTDPQKVPPTVLSRCLQFNLRPMAPQTVQEHLADVLAREAIPAEPGALRLLSRAARGSMRDALSLADQAIAFGGGSLAEEGVRQMLGAVDRGHAVRIIEALAAGDGAALIGAVDALRSLGLSAAGTLEEMAALLQQMAVLQAVPDASDPADPDSPTTSRLSGMLASDETQLLYSIVLHGRAELGLAPDEYSGLVMVLLRMLAFKPKGGTAMVAPRVDAAAKPTADVAQRPGPAASTVQIQATSPAALPSQAVAVEVAPTRSTAPAPASAPAAAPAPAPAPTRAAPVPAAVPLRTRPVTTATAQPAVDAPAPMASIGTSSSEPPPWLDVPDEDEASYGSSAGSSATSSDYETESMPYDEPVSRRDVPVPPQLASAAAPLRLTELGERWALRVKQMIDAGSIGAMVRELAMQAQCVSMDDKASPAICRLRVEREMLRAPATVAKLQTALSAVLNREVRIETESGVAEDSPARRDTAERDRLQGEAEQIIHNDPLVQALMAQYKTARIVPGSVKPH